MESDARVAIDGEDEEEDHANRLMALLHDLVRREGGRSGAARALAVDRRTVGTGMDESRLTQRLRGALEGVLQQENGSAAERPKPNDALERRLERLEKELHENLDAVNGEVKALREEHGRTLKKIEGRLARREAQQENRKESPKPADAPSTTGPAAATATDKQPATAAKFPKRLYPELVTKNPLPTTRWSSARRGPSSRSGARSGRQDTWAQARAWHGWRPRSTSASWKWRCSKSTG